MTRHPKVFARAALAAVILVLALTAAGCGSSSSSTSSGVSGAGTTAKVSHPKTKFVLHAGLAFGAFHHWIYKPAKAGDFAHPFLHKLTLIKAALAGVFVYHELKLALHDAQASPTLAKLVSPITALDNKIHSLAAGIRSGNGSPAQVTQANGSIGSLGQLASHAGQPISDLIPSSL
jgi:hypothetical protein